MTVSKLNNLVTTIPDPYKLEGYLDQFNVMKQSKGIFLSFVLDFYEMLADPNLCLNAYLSQELLPVFRKAASAMLAETTNHELIKYYQCNPNSVYTIRREVKNLIENCDIYAI